jgi:hypothetical protein
VAAVAGLMLLGVAVPAGSAFAAPPDNDTQAGAVEFGVPFSFTQDTTEATVDAGEDVARNYCLGIGAPAFESAVWFKTVVPPGGSTQAVLLDVTQSSYGAGIAILQETGTGLSVFNCVPGVFVGPAGAPAGTYYVVVFGDGTTPATSGNLVFNVDVAPPPPEVTTTLNPTGTATKEGGALISGTASCTGGGDGAAILFLEGQVTQTVGRQIISSFFFIETFVPCDGAPFHWQGYAPPTTGKFAGGKAVTATFTTACGLVQCSQAYVEGVVRLNRAPRR